MYPTDQPPVMVTHAPRLRYTQLGLSVPVPCRKCGGIYTPIGTVAHRQGYCGEACRKRRQVVTKTCACCGVSYETCHDQRSKFCGGACKARARQAQRVASDDLPADRIDALLEQLAQRRRVTRSWLRIDDPWAQRPGAAIHERHEWAGV
jgi:hypothetical protein